MLITKFELELDRLIGNIHNRADYWDNRNNRQSAVHSEPIVQGHEFRKLTKFFGITLTWQQNTKSKNNEYINFCDYFIYVLCQK